MNVGFIMSDRTVQIIEKLHALGDSDIAVQSQRFFKTGKGEYGEGDKFLGIRVPVIRKCAREYRALSLKDTLRLLKSPFHEARLLALLILVAKYSAARMNTEQEDVYRSYLSHTKFINNWDLVDCSAEHIVGAYLFLTHIMQLNISFPLHLILRAGKDVLCSIISQNAVFRL